jgi:hypothetical protein
MIKVGDVIQLRESIFQSEFEKMGRYSVWSNKYLYEDEFQYVCLKFFKLGKTGDMAKTLFGSSQTRVIHIEYDAEERPWIVTTDLYEIILREALDSKEISIKAYDEKNFRSLQAEKELVENLEHFEQKYMEGLFQINERENNKLDMYKLGLHRMIHEGKWKNAH